MAKSKIIKDLIGGKIELMQALERILVIAMEINDAETIKWIKKEKQGYGADETVPDYRILSLVPMGSFQIVSMGYIHTYNNHVLATMGVPDWYKNKYLKFNFQQGISQVIDQYKSMANSDNKYGIPVPPEMYPYFEEGTNMTVTNAIWFYSRLDLEKIIDAVKTRAIELLVLLEKNFGVLDNLDIDLDEYESNEIRKVQEACSVVIKGDNNGDTYIITNSKVKKSNIGKGNSSNKENNVQISPEFNVEKENSKSIWKKILGLFGGRK